MEEDDMVIRVGIAIPRTERERERRTDEGGKGYKPKELIRRCQGLAEVPLGAPEACTRVRGQKYPYTLVPLSSSIFLATLLPFLL